MSYKLITTGNHKMAKSYGFGYENFILHLAPGKISGRNVCPSITESCRKHCLNTSGMGAFSTVQNARIRKTNLYFENRKEFYSILFSDIERGIAHAQKKNLTPVFRLNGTSDILSLSVDSAKNFPNVQFYDYTKNPLSIYKYIEGKLPKNYHLTFSRSEVNDKFSKDFIKKGVNIAVVFRGKLPEKFWKYPVVNGDKHDLRFLDPVKSVVGLTPKGSMKKENNGFVINK